MCTMRFCNKSDPRYRATQKSEQTLSSFPRGAGIQACQALLAPLRRGDGGGLLGIDFDLAGRSWKYGWKVRQSVGKTQVVNVTQTCNFDCGFPESRNGVSDRT